MKIIYSKTEQVADRTTLITASSTNATYPVTNMSNENAGQPWRSATASPAIADVTLKVSLPAGTNNAIGLFGLNATSLVIDVKNTAEDTTYFTETFDLTPSSPARTWNRVWKEWTSNGFALTVVITLTAPATATYHECAEIVAGATVTIPDPSYGLKQSRRDTAQRLERVGGGLVVFNGEKPREFNLSWLMLRETVYDDVDEIYEEMGSRPLAMLLSDYLNNDMKWCGYFHMRDAPAASHHTPNYSQVTCSLTEAC